MWKRLYVCMHCILFFSPIFVFSQIIFEDNFDNSSDWTPIQPNQDLFLTSWGNENNIPQNYDSIYLKGTFYENNLHNTLEINSQNPKDDVGKSLNVYAQSDTRTSQNFSSIGELGINLGDQYEELYITFYIKFNDWTWNSNEDSIANIIKLTHYESGNPHLDENSKPQAIFGLSSPQNIQNTYAKLSYRYENTFLPNKAYPYHLQENTFLLNNDIISSQDWHKVVLYFKMNSNVASTDGIYTFWLDGSLIANVTDLAFSDSGASNSPRKYWNYVTIGGDIKNNYAPYQAETQDSYSIDDLVISTTKLSSDYIVGTSDKSLVIRKFSTTTPNPNEEINVTLYIINNGLPQGTLLILEEIIPQDFTIIDLADGPRWATFQMTPIGNQIKRYVLQAPSEKGVYTFDGDYALYSELTKVGGSTQVDVGNTKKDFSFSYDEDYFTNTIQKDNIKIFQNENAKIEYFYPIKLTKDTQISTQISLEQNKISVNSDSLPDFNRAATLTFYNITFKNPQVYKDNTLLSKSFNFQNNILTINVTGFSIYEIKEKIETTTTQTTTQTKETTKTKTTINPYVQSNCTSNIECSSWSECSNNIQERNCFDKNQCKLKNVTEERKCYIANSDIENALLNIRLINITKIDEKHYIANLKGTEELAIFNIQINQEAIIITDNTSQLRYLAIKADKTQKGEDIFSIQEIDDQITHSSLLEQYDLEDKTTKQALTDTIDKIGNNRIIITIAVVISVLTIITLYFIIIFYKKKQKQKLENMNIQIQIQQLNHQDPLKDYINAHRLYGTLDFQIKNNLVAAGWDSSTIDAKFKEMQL